MKTNKQKNKKLALFGVGMVVFFLIGSLSLVSAQDIQKDVGLLEEFFYNLKHWVGTSGTYSIIGEYRSCEITPRRTFSYELGEEMKVDVKDYCHSEAGLINFFTDGWVPVSEKKNSISISSCNVPPCHIEVYCCPFDECETDSDCEDWYGEGSECIKSYEKDPNINYEYDHFYYCSLKEMKLCWYVADSTCEYRHYDINLLTDCSKQTYMGKQLFNSKSQCEESILINGNGEYIPCRGKGQTFFTNAIGKDVLTTWLISWREEITPEIIDSYIPEFSARYFENKEDACCSGLEYVWEDSKQMEITPVSVLFGLIGSRKLSFTWDIYKCVPEGEAGFCLKFAHQLLNPILHTDDCKLNTIILVASILLIFILLFGLGGGRRK